MVNFLDTEPYESSVHRASCLTLEINVMRVKIEESEKASSLRQSNPGHSCLSHQCSATEPRQPDDHQPSQSYICTAQVVLKASVMTPGSHSPCAVRTPLGVG